MATKIVTKNSSTASAVPTASDLVQGELAVNVADKRLFTEDNGGSIVELGTNPSSLTVSGNIDVDGVTNLDAVDIDGAVDMASTLQVDGAATFTTEITANGGIALGDNDKATFGASDDLQIFHDGSNSHIKDAGSGGLRLSTNQFRVYNAATDELSINAVENGTVELYYDNSKKFETTSTGIDVTGTVEADGGKIEAAAPVVEISSTSVSDLASIHFTTSGGAVDSKITHQANTSLMTIDSGRNASWGGKIDFVTDTDRRMRISNNGDISFYEDTGTTPKFFWDASAESLGIGTSSPSGLGHSLVVSKDSVGGATYATITNTNANQFLNLGINGDVAEITWDEYDSLAFGTTAVSTDEGQTTERMRINSAGNVGIGTASIVDSKLHLKSTSSTNLRIEGGDPNSKNIVFTKNTGGTQQAKISVAGENLTFTTGTTSERMRINSSGNVGIGTANPTQKLHIDGGTGNAIARLQGDATLRLDFGTSSDPDAGRVEYLTTSNAMRLFTANTERMRIDSSGNVGIGSSSPVGKIHSVAANNQVAVMADGDVSDPLYPAFGFGGQIGSNGGRGAGMYLPSDGTLAWSTAGSEAMRISSAGLVGISTSDPKSALEVKGTFGAPATSGSAAGFISRFSQTSGVGSLDFGFGDPYSWIQSRRSDDYATNFDLALQPNGGNVGIGNSIPSSFNGNANNLVIGTGSGSEGMTIYGGGESNIFFADGTAGSSAYVGRIEYSHAVDNMLFYVNNANAMTIDSSGNVGIGVSTPSNNHANANNLVVGNGTAGGIANYVGTGTGWYAFSRANANNSDAYDGGISYDGSRNLMFHTNAGTERARINSSGNLLVGATVSGAGAQSGISIDGGETDSNIYIRHANGTGSGSRYMAFTYNTSQIGSITQNGSSQVLYNISSDQRLKENIADADDAGSKVDAIQVRKFDWKADGSHQDYGMIAQELQAVAPEAVSVPEDSEEMMGVDYSKLVPMLIKEIQSLRNRVAQLEE